MINKLKEKIILDLNEHENAKHCQHSFSTCTWTFRQEENSPEVKKCKLLEICNLTKDILSVTIDGERTLFEFGVSDKQDEDNYKIITALISEFVPQQKESS